LQKADHFFRKISYNLAGKRESDHHDGQEYTSIQ
jgi:hypothetical protein